MTLSRCPYAGCTTALAGPGSFVPGTRYVYGPNNLDEERLGVGAALHVPTGTIWAYGGRTQGSSGTYTSMYRRSSSELRLFS